MKGDVVTSGLQNVSSNGKGRVPRMRAGQAYGAIDLGTNNCRLLIARPRGKGFQVVDAFSRIVRLGEGLAESGQLSDAAMARTLEALEVCASRLRRRGVTQVRAVATEACRRASNCDSFVAQVYQDTGIRLEVISNREEVGLAADGCVPLLNAAVPHALIFDIGGGSTEISWLRVTPGERRERGRKRVAHTQLADWCSMPFGVVNFAERYDCREVKPETYESMVAEVAQQAAVFEAQAELSALVADQAVQLLGTSGTVTTLTGVYLGLPRYDRARVDGYHMEMETVYRISRSILDMSFEERRNHACIGPDRADLVIAGCAILEGLCRVWPVQRLRVADRGLREGMLRLMMVDAGVWRRPQAAVNSAAS